MKHPSKSICGLSCLMVAAILSVLLIYFTDIAPASTTDLRIGSKKFTENVILANIAGLILEQEGLDVQYQHELGGTRILWEAMQRGDLAIYPEYTGTLQFEILMQPDLDSWEKLQSALLEQGIGISPPLGFNNTYGVGMRRQHAKKLGIEKVSDLQRYPDLVYGLGHEFIERADGWSALKQRYTLPEVQLRGMDHDIAYRAIANKSIDVMDVYTTDAEIEAYDLLVLEDDLSHFPRYEAVYVYRSDIEGLVKPHLEQLAGKISEQKMIRMNAAAKLGGVAAMQVAANYLEDVFHLSIQVTEVSLFDEILDRSREHIFLVLVSLAAAIVVAVPLGMWAANWQRSGQFILAIVGMIQTMPSLALLVIMIPIFGIGAFPALVALFFYSLLPIVRGTYLGFSSISNEMRETAEVLGLSAISRFHFVYWPLALSSVLSGIKTAAVINVGTATLGALIGAGGFGQTMLRGIRLDDSQLILAGALPAACLALLVQWLFDLLERFSVSPGLKI
ncbi:MAG: glycine betaine ABC transporter substrate-binding protein [Oligoflexus sp.]